MFNRIFSLKMEVIASTTIISAMLTFLIITCKTSGEICGGLTSYQLQLSTFWSKETFYRQYPTYRPNAQWSRLIGRTHNGRYSVWSEGELATEALREFTEQGLTTIFDVEAQGSKGIFDAFIGPNVASGVGYSATKFLAHSNYSKLSFVVRIIPSPDWFIGVDSLELFTDGEWISEKTLELRPLDSGTDRGFSFTSPNWPEEPQKTIYAMTSTFPNHPASSFYYPEWADLPPMAQLKLTRVYPNWIDEPEDISSSSASPAFHGTNFEMQGESVSDANKFASVDNRAVVVLGKSMVVTELGMQHNQQNSNDSQQTVAKSVIRKKYSDTRTTKLLKSGRTVRIKNEMTDGVHVDCLVTEWSDWGPCSKTCGFGVRARTRSIIRRQHNGGKRCPLLREEQLCGGVRKCSI